MLGWIVTEQRSKRHQIGDLCALVARLVGLFAGFTKGGQRNDRCVEDRCIVPAGRGPAVRSGSGQEAQLSRLLEGLAGMRSRDADMVAEAVCQARGHEAKEIG